MNKPTKEDRLIEEMEHALGIDEKSQRKFENMMCGYFGLRSVDDLYKLREIVEKMHEMFVDVERDVAKRCAKCNALLRYPEDTNIKGITLIEVDMCSLCKKPRVEYI